MSEQKQKKRIKKPGKLVVFVRKTKRKRAAKKKKAAARIAADHNLYTRRTLFRAAGAMGLTLGGAALLHNRDNGMLTESFEVIRDHRVEQAAGATQMAIVHGPDPAMNARRAVEAIGGMAAFIKKGESVVIKPNIGWNRVPEQAANTDPRVVAEVVRMVRAAGAGKIWLADCPVNTPDRCFKRSGILDAVSEVGNVTVKIPNGSGHGPGYRYVDVGGGTLGVSEVFAPFIDAQKIINVPVAKQHGLTNSTVSMKNWYGVLGGHRTLLHQDIHGSILDLAMMMRPTLTVMDGTRVLLANGPSGGNLDDVKEVNLVAAGIDPVAIDAFGTSLVGFKAEDVRYIGMAEKAGLGTADYKSLKLEEIGS
jgi:uncharacterized protein (DUF362 family)